MSSSLEVMAGATATVQANAALAFSGTSSLKGTLTAESMAQVEFAGSYFFFFFFTKISSLLTFFL